ncbi:hypothetical protein HPP92_028200 [Vanilla planifolia]|uniref:Uncharacterized protein n=1 Tax=Vanilla planifolia TaxID=51239 RepID=A0A835P853_VANPL|nr:hypothetical protein HPP92_028200 [Vanilla planifolia]
MGCVPGGLFHNHVKSLLALPANVATKHTSDMHSPTTEKISCTFLLLQCLDRVHRAKRTQITEEASSSSKVSEIPPSPPSSQEALLFPASSAPAIAWHRGLIENRIQKTVEKQRAQSTKSGMAKTRMLAAEMMDSWLLSSSLTKNAEQWVIRSLFIVISVISPLFFPPVTSANHPTATRSSGWKAFLLLTRTTAGINQNRTGVTRFMSVSERRDWRFGAEDVRGRDPTIKLFGRKIPLPEDQLLMEEEIAELTQELKQETARRR